MLTLYPAIDIRGGRAVRLLQGDYDRETGYDADPVDAARRWVEGGAAIVHVVDLDGARAGAPANLEVVERIAARGRRSGPARRRAARSARASKRRSRPAPRAPFSAPRRSAIPSLLGSLADAYGDRIVASVDARGGRVAVEGWEQATDTAVEDAITDLGIARDPSVRLHAGRGRRDARGPRPRPPRAASSTPARRPARS